jgi:cytochrome c5
MTGKRIAAAAVAAWLLLCGIAVAADPPAGKGKALFEEKCVICHDLNRALSQKKNKKGWTATVTRMKNVNGCPITDKEAGQIIQYLTAVRGSK